MTTRISRKSQLAIEAANGCRGHGDYRRTQCPFCADRLGSESANPNFWVSQATGFYGCHRCETKGRLPGFDDGNQYIPEPTPSGVSTEPTAYLGPPDGYVSAMTPGRAVVAAVKYLRTRGVTRSIAEESQIGVCVDGHLAGRVVLPVIGLDGKTWLGWSARLYREPTSPYERKYTTCPGMERASTIFNIRALASTRPEPVLCCEGVFDAIQYWPNTVAFLGKPGDGHADLLLASRRAVAICLDGDAWREGEALARKLRRQGKANVGYVRLPPKMDPNSVDPVRLRSIAIDSVRDGYAEY